MSSEEPTRPRIVQPEPEPKSLDGGIASDVAHIAGLLGPEDFEPPAALSPRPAEIREDVRVLAVTLFESAKAETVRPSMKTKLKDLRRVLAGGSHRRNSYTRNEIKRVPCGSCS